MNFSDYVKREKLQRTRAFSSRLKWGVAGGMVLISSAAALLFLRSDILTFGAEVAREAEYEEQSDWLESGAIRSRMKSSAENLYGCEVEWIILPKSHFGTFSGVMLDRIPRGAELSFLTLEDGKFGAYLPDHAKASILKRIDEIEAAKAGQDGAGKPATRSESDSEGGVKPQPESEGRSR